MSSQRNGKASLFLMEMMVVILFFAITSAICVHLFVQSHQTGQQSEALTNGVIQAESAAEVYKSTDGDLKKTAAILQAQWQADAGLTLAYDAKWQPTDETDNVRYVLHMTETKTQPVKAAEILLCTTNDQEIYRLTVQAYKLGGDDR